MASDVETDAARNRWTVAALNATSHRVHLPRRVRPNAATASLCGGRAASRTRTRWPAIDVSPRGTTNRPPLAWTPAHSAALVRAEERLRGL